MSYTRNGITVIRKSNPEANYIKYYSDIEKKIIADNYISETSMEFLIANIVAFFDSDENYGERGDYGEEFTLEQCFRYIEDCGGYKEFDYHWW